MFSKIFVMKRFVVYMLALILVVSCPSNVFRGEEQIGDDYIYLSSKGFDGEKSYKIKVVSDTSALMIYFIAKNYGPFINHKKK